VHIDDEVKVKSTEVIEQMKEDGVSLTAIEGLRD